MIASNLSLKKLCNSPIFVEAIADLVNSLDTSMVLQDIKGRFIFGDESKMARDKFPVEVNGEVLGWVIGEAKVAPIASFISCLANKELEKKLLAKELLDTYREINFIYDISEDINSILDIYELASLLLEKGKELIKSTSGSVMRLNHVTEQLEIVSVFGQQCHLHRKTIPLGEGIVGTIVRNGVGEIVNHVKEDPRCIGFEAAMSSLICVPLVSKDRLIGAISLVSLSTYTAADLKRLNTLASQAAAAMENAQLYQESCIAAATAQSQAEKLQQALRELQETQAQLIQTEKMSSLGQLVAGVAHEINNPINFISGNLWYAQQYTEELLQIMQLYQQEFPSVPPVIEEAIEDIDLDFLYEDLPKMISSMKVGTDRIREIVLSLRNFSRLDEAETKPVDIHSGIDSTLLILKHRLKAQAGRPKIKLCKDYGKLPQVDCHASSLNQVFMNILSNAIDAIEEQQKPGIITVSTEFIREPQAERHIFGKASALIPKEAAGGDRVAIRIRDNGPGISSEVRSRLFDPFFTTKPVGKGTGLGLSISYKIVVEKHGGIIECFSEPGLGTEFCIQIPLKLSCKRLLKYNYLVGI